MKYRGIFEYEYPTEHKPPVSIDVHLHGDCVKGKIIEWEYRPLEQEPCEDCISRQAVLDAIDVKAWEFCDYLISKNRNDEQKPVSHFADNLRECVREEFPPVTPQPKWISVSERLPYSHEYIQNNGLFIVSDGNRSYSEWFDIYDTQKFGEPTMNGFRVDYAVTAWMPLPEPYDPQERRGEE